ncbi:MAG: hypothetical protein K1X35_09925 [Caulobacteraceae bacterium]|nr:hypothetical protein [Caulobacteraceae bacterium]
MASYTLHVVYRGRAAPAETIEENAPQAVLETIPRLLQAHPDCHRIIVYSGPTHIFSVDCNGATVRD